MPLCTLHLLSLLPTTPAPISTFLSTLNSTGINRLVTARVIRWIILPTRLSITTLLAQNIHWDLLLIIPSSTPLPPKVLELVQHHWSITAGIPSSLVQDFHKKNERLLHPAAHGITVPPLSNPPATGEGKGKEKKTLASSSQNLELSSELQSWITQYLHSHPSSGAISMLNLLAFHPGAKSSYLKYGAAFASSIGSRHGGYAKLVGTVIPSSGFGSTSTSESEDREGWDEIALAHYPTLGHFGEMLASEDYQAVNKKYRVGSLRDTCILMTEEIGAGEMARVGKGARL